MFTHEPVLLEEVIENLELKPGDGVIDGTLGGGGHSLEILRRIMPSGRLIGFDQDPAAIKAAKENLKEFSENLELINDNYRNLKDYGKQLDLLPKTSGILLDLGVSSYQITGSRDRGFSFKGSQEPLDMRMDPRMEKTAADILNHYSKEDLKKIFREYGEEDRAGLISKRIVENRPFKTVQDLVEIIPSRRSRIHPATKTFQALRIEVNDELGALEEFLPQAIDLLDKGSRLVIITFHSLEDRIVKHFFKEQAKDCVCPPQFPECRCDKEQLIKIITKKPIIASEEEIERNPRSRSAKLRVVEKI